MEICVLGSLTLRSGGVERRLGGIKQQALFAMLAVRMNEDVSVRALVDGLWDGILPDHPRRTIQVYVSRLRNLISNPAPGEPALAIAYRGDRYALIGEPQTCDLNRFQGLAARGYALWPADPQGTRTALREALTQWRADPLQEFTREPFAEAECVRLSSLHTAALDLRVEADLACGFHQQLVPELEELARRWPLNERVHGQLMVALYRSLRPADALAVFRRLRLTLARELAIEPSEMLQGLERAVLARSPGLDHPGPSSWTDIATSRDAGKPIQPPIDNRPIQNLPARLHHFVGRERLLADLIATTRATRRARIVHVLHGLGGVGKSQTALEFAHRVADRFSCRWWINAEEPGLISQQIAELGRAAGIRFPASSNPSATVMAWLATRDDWLMIFDNAAEPVSTARFLPDGRGIVLVTSRRRGWGELGRSSLVDIMSRDETVALLTARFEHLDPTVADQIAAEIGDLPLAAAQVASYLDQTDINPGRYLEMFRTQQSLLLGRGDVIGYPARVDTTWTLSFARLRDESPAGLALIETASMLAPDDIPIDIFSQSPGDASEPLFGDPVIVEDALATAVKYSLATRRTGGFQIHRLVQQVIRQNLSPERRTRLSAIVSDLLIARRPGPPDRPEHWHSYQLIAPHVLAAEESLECSAAGRRLVLDTVSYLSATGDPRSTRQYLSQIRNRWSGELGNDHTDVLHLSSELLYLSIWTGRADAAAALGDELLECANRALGPAHPNTLATAAHHSLALAWNGSAALALTIGRSTADRAHATLGPHHPTTLLALANITSAYGWLGNHVDACEVGTLAHERSRQVLGPDHALTLHAASMLSYAKLWVGDIEHAYQLAKESFDRVARVHAEDHPTALWLASTLAFAQLRFGQVDEAQDLAVRTYRRAALAMGVDHTVVLVAGSVAGLTALRAGALDQMRTIAQPTWEGLVRVHGADHPIALGVATTLCLGAAAAADRRLTSLTFAWDTSARSDRLFGDRHPNSVNARRSAEALDAFHRG